MQLYKDIYCITKPVKEKVSGALRHEVVYDKAIYIVMCENDIVRFDTKSPKDVVAFYTFEELPDRFIVSEDGLDITPRWTRLYNLLVGNYPDTLKYSEYVESQLFEDAVMEISTYYRYPHISCADDGKIFKTAHLYHCVGTIKNFDSYIKMHRYTDTEWEYILKKQGGMI